LLPVTKTNRSFLFSFVKVVLNLQLPSNLSELCKLHYLPQDAGNWDFPMLTANTNYQCQKKKACVPLKASFLGAIYFE